MKRVLITGSNGFIGRHSLPLLLEKGYELHGVVPEEGMQLKLPYVQWHVADLLNFIQIQSLVKKVKPSHLLHFAWNTKPSEYWTSVENVRWLQASLELMQAFKLYGGRRILIAGTCAEYDWKYGYCSEYITPLNPTTLYGTCKKTLYEVLMAFSQQEGLSVSWGRIFFLYGPHEHPSRLIPSVINALLKQQPAPCTHGNQIRDFMYVEDVASAFVALLDSNLEGAFNIASGDFFSIKNIVCQIANKIEKNDLIQFGKVPSPENETLFLGADVKRLQNNLGWAPSYSLDAGLDKTIDWWKTRL